MQEANCFNHYGHGYVFLDLVLLLDFHIAKEKLLKNHNGLITFVSEAPAAAPAQAGAVTFSVSAAMDKNTPTAATTSATADTATAATTAKIVLKLYTPTNEATSNPS